MYCAIYCAATIDIRLFFLPCYLAISVFGISLSRIVAQTLNMQNKDIWNKKDYLYCFFPIGCMIIPISFILQSIIPVYVQREEKLRILTYDNNWNDIVNYPEIYPAPFGICISSTLICVGIVGVYMHVKYGPLTIRQIIWSGTIIFAPLFGVYF